MVNAQTPPTPGDPNTPEKIATMIAHLERVNRNPQQEWVVALRDYKDIPPERWPMPIGFRQRVAPEYFSKIYSVQGRTGGDYGREFLLTHGASTCNIAQGMVDALDCVDHLLLTDHQKTEKYRQ